MSVSCGGVWNVTFSLFFWLFLAEGMLLHKRRPFQQQTLHVEHQMLDVSLFLRMIRTLLTYQDRRNAAECSRIAEEHKSWNRNGQLVEIPNHTVGGRGGGSNAPSRCIRNTERWNTRENHCPDSHVAHFQRATTKMCVSGRIALFSHVTYKL